MNNSEKYFRPNKWKITQDNFLMGYVSSREKARAAVVGHYGQTKDVHFLLDDQKHIKVKSIATGSISEAKKEE